MRRVLPFSALCLALAAAACQDAVSVSVPSTPRNLTYELEPSGDPDQPLGILLVWDDVGDADLASYRVYSRGSASGSFGLRGETTSNTFHDNGVPHLDYFVTAVDVNGNESAASNVIRVNEWLQLERPATLTSISLNGAIHLEWADNAYQADPTLFSWYRIYSTSYDLDLGVCGATWMLEGTTIAPEFLVSAMTNGVPRCFGVSAVSRLGYESLWSPLRQDTPRPDARNVLVYALQQNATQAGFRFWNDANNDGKGQSAELGLVESGNAADIDFRVTRGLGDTLWIEPIYSGTRLQVYGQVGDLTSIDFAPAAGYSRNLFQAVPTYGYVFEIVEGASTLRYGAVRVTHVGRDYMIFDWSLQTDLGNPELLRRAGQVTSLSTGSEVPGSQ
ncbi:MAG TPA: hypothetical protein VEK86_13035 [Gemmatimonadales bacterium]|nr:hypothetical protein [Gemmatimonadales bacterium]